LLQTVTEPQLIETWLRYDKHWGVMTCVCLSVCL